jgi:pyridoxal phosphate enzyme (YggS family)
MLEIADRIARVRRHIALVAQDCNRDPEAIRLLAVSKKHPAAAIRAAFQTGQRDFGESYVQEALDKMRQLRDLPLQWHFIGRIQSNKTRDISANFSWIHALCDLHHARRLAAQRPPELSPLQCCIQVNLSGEASKAGIAATDLTAFAAAVAPLRGLRLRGLMTMSALGQETEQQYQLFRQLQELIQQLRAQGLPLDTLSMGMSGDLEPAIRAGATMVRIGTAIFGPRET